MKITILSVNINAETKDEILRDFYQILLSNSYENKVVVTPNPEILVHSHKSFKLRNRLNNADYSLADGIGIILMAKLFFQKVNRIVGADIVKELLGFANKHSLKILLIDWIYGLSTKDEIYNGLKKQYPNLKLKILQIDREKEINKDLLVEIQDYQADILLNTLGNPYQENFLLKYKNQLNSKLALAVGASIDFIISKQDRAPKIMRKMGLEWLYRWLKKPIKRSKRMFNALIVFPILFLYYKFRTYFLYRPNVITLLYRESDYKILIAEKNPKNKNIILEENDWEIPQGGIEKNESIEDAALRELSEELGISSENLELKEIHKNCWKYKWKNPDIKHFKAYKGQKQSLAIIKLLNENIEFDLSKEGELINYEFLSIEDAIKKISNKRKAKSQKVFEIYKNFLQKNY